MINRASSPSMAAGANASRLRFGPSAQSLLHLKCARVRGKFELLPSDLDVEAVHKGPVLTAEQPEQDGDPVTS